MNKTGDEIELDVFNIITNSQLAKEIKGNVYREDVYKRQESRCADNV